MLIYSGLLTLGSRFTMLHARTVQAEKLPGPPGFPLLGTAIGLFNQREHFFQQAFQCYGSVFQMKLLNINVVVLIGPEANQLVLKDKAEILSTSQGYSLLVPLLGNGILFQEGQEHQFSRKLMYPAFHDKAVSSYFQIVQQTAKEFVQSHATDKAFPLWGEFQKLTLTIACRLFLGAQEDDQIQTLSHHFNQLVEGIQTIVRWDSTLTKYGRGQAARRKLEQHIYSVVTERRQRGSFNALRDTLDLLIAATDEDGRALSDAEVVKQTLQLLFGGHETLSKMLTWSVFELSRHPQWVERLRQEQFQVLGKGELVASHLRQLDQLGNFLKEVERLYPPAYAIPRGVLQDIEFAGHHIPAGWHIYISPFVSHRLDEIFSNPERFDPDRFAPPRQEHKKHPFALIGFGGGLHRCLGYELAQMEIKVILTTILERFNLKVNPEYNEATSVLEPTNLAPILQAQFLPR